MEEATKKLIEEKLGANGNPGQLDMQISELLNKINDTKEVITRLNKEFRAIAEERKQYFDGNITSLREDLETNNKQDKDQILRLDEIERRIKSESSRVDTVMMRLNDFAGDELTPARLSYEGNIFRTTEMWDFLFKKDKDGAQLGETTSASEVLQSMMGYSLGELLPDIKRLIEEDRTNKAQQSTLKEAAKKRSDRVKLIWSVIGLSGLTIIGFFNDLLLAGPRRELRQDMVSADEFIKEQLADVSREQTQRIDGLRLEYTEDIQSLESELFKPAGGTARAEDAVQNQRIEALERRVGQ